MHFEFDIALRLYRTRGGAPRASRLARYIATAGVAVGLTVMIISVSVVIGFKGEIRDKVRGFGGDIEVLNLKSLQSQQQEPLRLAPEQEEALRSVRGVRCVERFCERAAMLKTDDAFRGIMLRGVGEEYDTTFLSAHLVEGTLRLRTATDIVLSRRLAQDLSLQLGSRIYCYAFEGGIKARRLTVAGIYETHMTDFDASIVYAPLRLAQGLAGWDSTQVSGYTLLIDPHASLDETARAVRDASHQARDLDGAYLAAPTIRDLYPGLYAWLSLLDANVWVILALMIAVAAFTMISGLLILILERTHFIGVMKALGATNSQLRHTFLLLAMLIVGQALVVGNVLALALIVVQQQTGLIHLDPETYYVDTVPMAIHWGYILLINLLTLTLTFLALIVPSYVVSHIHPARSIRFE